MRTMFQGPAGHYLRNPILTIGAGAHRSGSGDNHLPSGGRGDLSGGSGLLGGGR